MALEKIEIAPGSVPGTVTLRFVRQRSSIIAEGAQAMEKRYEPLPSSDTGYLFVAESLAQAIREAGNGLRGAAGRVYLPVVYATREDMPA